MAEKKLHGHIIRDAIQKEYQGRPMFCGRCGLFGRIGHGLDIVYTEQNLGPFGGDLYSVWAACSDAEGCKERQKDNK